ncbi:resolvase, partial [Massilia sp. JS1662]
MSKLLSIGAAAKTLGVSTSTLRRWEAAGRLVPIRTEGGQRRYDLAALRPGHIHGVTMPLRTVAYARVSSHDQR